MRYVRSANVIFKMKISEQSEEIYLPFPRSGNNHFAVGK